MGLMAWRRLDRCARRSLVLGDGGTEAGTVRCHRSRHRLERARRRQFLIPRLDAQTPCRGHHQVVTARELGEQLLRGEGLRGRF